MHSISRPWNTRNFWFSSATSYSIVDMWKNNCLILMKCRWCERWLSGPYHSKETNCNSLHFFQFLHIFDTKTIFEFSEKSKFSEILSFWNFIFQHKYMIEYLSNWHEKLMVRKVNIWSFQHCLKHFRTTFRCSCDRQNPERLKKKLLKVQNQQTKIWKIDMIIFNSQNRDDHQSRWTEIEMINFHKSTWSQSRWS